MSGSPKRHAPPFVLSMSDEGQAIACGVLVFDKNIETEPSPKIVRSEDGHFDEINAARYLSYKMRNNVSSRTMRRWRDLGVGPSYYCGPKRKPIWYRQADLDEFIEVKCAA